MDMQALNTLVERCGEDHTATIALLQEIQATEGYLPRKTLVRLSQRLKLPLSRVYGLATFDRSFSMTPTGRHRVCVCLGTACHVRGAPSVMGEVQRQLGVGPGETTKDMQFTLESVNCVGACAMGPIVIVDGKYHGQMSPGKVKKCLKGQEKTQKGPKDEKAQVSR
jgi:NADH-quinone oxidoreductase subunit E